MTDNASSTTQTARAISVLLDAYKTVVRPAESFAGTDLLPARIFMLGCERPNPSSFAYLEELLQHINLAGRKCGVFSADRRALKYLAGLVKDSEAATGDPLLTEDGTVKPAVLKKWLKRICA